MSVHPKPLSVSPLKSSQPLGASLAFLGLARAMPLMHGSQGCTAFGKVFFVRHFREPIPLQTTAMDQVSSIMGADENIAVALQTLIEKNQPDLIGLVTTGLSETQGTDLARVLREFRARQPQFDSVAIVPVNTPDYLGCLETGFALAVESLIETLVPEGRLVGRRPRQVNVLASSMLTPGDLEVIREWVEAFGLEAIVLPDLSGSLDGHLVPEEFSSLTLGGTSRAEIAALGESVATLVIGRSLSRAAERLKAKTGVPDFHFSGLMGLEAADSFTQTLAHLSGRPVPPSLERQRAQLQDAMVDCHFMLGFARLALAADPDLLLMLGQFLRGMGAEIVAAVSPVRAESLAALDATITIGDLEDLAHLACQHAADLLLANSHGVETARRLGLPLLRVGFPQYDQVGGHARAWVGYRGTRQALFDLANLLLSRHHDVHPYRSLYWQDTPRSREAGAAAHTGSAHA
ncbi:MAG: nitrogenase iron-molybdenum cofactor biosynthesis protein NifN [Zoogloeaceae bacterium]|jgi:nitrogenase molybdenum-iron protein NifN|nr:nitrogenase iron-molybdenum cofactor biosynthesis protein NifN [Zoogloeaceae bacterium]